MTNIHLIGGEKGGVGKSLVARLLAQYMIDNSIEFLAYDSDRSHGARRTGPAVGLPAQACCVSMGRGLCRCALHAAGDLTN